jgi:hypothetical protein
MTKMMFNAAVARVQEENEAEAAGDAAEPKILEFGIAGQEFKLNVPNDTQIIMLATAADGATVRELFTASMEFLEGLLLGDGYRRLRKLVASGVITDDLLVGGDDANERGIIDWIVAQVSDGRPTQPSPDSSPSPAPAGRKSTGRSPGKGSIPSVSPSPAS